MPRRGTPDRALSGSDFLMMVGVGALAVIALVVSTVSFGFAVFGTESDAAAGAAGGGGTTTVDVMLMEFSVTPAVIEVPAGDTLVLNVTNDGAMVHDLKLDGETGTAMLDPGESETIDLGVMDADAEIWCTVPGHKESGMTASIVVTGGGGAASSDGDATSAESVDTEDGFATIDPDAKPAADWRPFDPTLQPAPGGTEHEITLRATETELEVAPGVTQMMWTFEDQVPGPILRGKVGDLFTVTLVNEGEVGHSIDFHASKVAWDDEMRTIESGEELVYQFRAEHAGAFMYHCGTSPALHHIGNGMYGAIIIDPPELAPVAKEFVMVQSELYLGPQGKEGDLAKMQDEDFDAVVFNGYWNQYAFDPIDVEANERIRVWVIDDGPSENSAFHIVGTIFDTVWKEGSYLLQPDERQGGSQVLDLQPAQGGFVEFTLAEDGFYPMVTHKFSNVGKGALGMFRAGDVEMPDAAGH
jgi:nitrite reductase (NO-forming)